MAYCNDNSIEFLAYGRGHGFTTTLKAFKGLQINMGQLAEINVSEDEESVFVQGGLDNGQVQEALWTQGFVTGRCTMSIFDAFRLIIIRYFVGS